MVRITTATTLRERGNTRRDPSVLWVHNTERKGNMFLWDVLDAIPPAVTISEAVVPLRPNLRSVRRSIKQIRLAARCADLVHAQFGSLVGLFASFTSRPLILSLRGTDFYRLPGRGLRARMESKFRQLFTFVACLRADMIVVMSKRMRNELYKWPFMSRKHVVVMTDPVGDEFLEDHWPHPRSNLKEGPSFKIFVGSLSANNPVKRAWIVEEAVDLCQSAGIPVGLQIISGVPRSVVKEVLDASDAVALVSTHEGWPNVIKEGVACGLPFIATDVSDLVDFCGSNSASSIVSPHQLDVAFSIVDLIARKRFGPSQPGFFSETVGVKHELLYRYALSLK